MPLSGCPCGKVVKTAFFCIPNKVFCDFNCSGYFRLIPGGVRRRDVLDRWQTKHFLIENKLFQCKIDKIRRIQT